MSGLSTDLIQITSNFNGTDIVIFGAIEATGEITASKDQDLVIVIRGPPVDMTVRRKERVFGVWINREQIQLSGMPGYYFLASTGPSTISQHCPRFKDFVSVRPIWKQMCVVLRARRKP